ncbi:MAG: outer membrane protein, partial [Alphaproteobacteria bacterium]
MNLKKAGLAIGVAAIIGAPAVSAQADGFYLGLFGGANLMFSDTKGNLNTALLPPNTGVSYSFDPTTTGAAVGGVIGWSWDWGLRVEGEAAWRRNNFNFASASITNPGIPTGGINIGVTVDGSVQTISGMINAYYDFRVWRLRPYVGVGIGAAQSTLHIKSGLIGASVNSDDVTFAFQAMAGVNFPVTPNVMVGFEYRFFGVLGPDWDVSNFTAGLATTTLNNRNIYSHALLLTAKYSFNGDYKVDTVAPANPLHWAQGWYVGLQGGVNFQHSNSFDLGLESTGFVIPALPP